MKLVFAIDIAGQEHSRAKTLSLLRGITQRSAKLDVVTDITRGGNSSGEIRRPKLDLIKMRMHVPKTGQQEFSAGVYDRCRIRNFDLRARPGGNYAIALNHHSGICDRRFSSHINQSAADQDQRTLAFRTQLICKLRQPINSILHSSFNEEGLRCDLTVSNRIQICLN